MDIPIPVQEALRDSITSGTFIDTKFWVFSKRNPKTGRVGEPKALFVNGHVIRRVPRLGALLGRKETKENLRARFPADRKPYTSDYDYDADSDLEEDEDCDFCDFEDPKVAQEKGEGDKTGPSAEDIQNSDREGNASSDVVSVSDMESLFSDPSETTAEAKIVSHPSAHIGTVVVIDDVAFVTFQALLRYLYTNEIEFAPWGSEKQREARANLEGASEPNDIPEPSPKSMYRLADKYDIPELKELALQQIQRDLSKCDIVEEVFSEYTSRYPEVIKLELEQLTKALLSTNPSAVRRALKDKIKAYSCGQLPHARDILPALYESMESIDSLKGRTKAKKVQFHVPSDQGTTAGDWGGLKDALTRSITSGTFLDSQFYALDSKSGSDAPKVRPIYLCSMGSSTFVPKLLKYSSRIGPFTKTLLQRADTCDSDVDDETSDTGIPVDAAPRSACISERPLPACESPAPALVLKSGTVKAWSAIVFYVYTSQIAFSAIESPGMAAESQEEEAFDGLSPSEASPPQELETISSPPSETTIIEPCSPKSVYGIASKIGLTHLRDLAFDNIESQLCEANIVRELFSVFTASHKHIMEMENELFHSEFKHLVERSSLLDVIKDSPSGENPHRAAAMELIFDQAIDDCRERVFAAVEKSSPADPTAQPDSGGCLNKTTQSAAPQPSSTQMQSIPTTVHSVQTQGSQTKQDMPNAQPSQPSVIEPEVKNIFPRKISNLPGRAPTTVPKNSSFGGPPPAPSTAQTTASVFGPRNTSGSVFGANFAPQNTVPGIQGRPPTPQEAGNLVWSQWNQGWGQ